MKNKICVLFILIMILAFNGCKNTWSSFVDTVLNTKEIEHEYGKPRTTFYTCLYSDRDPRIPIINPVEMYKDEELGWTLRTIELNGNSTCGDYHQIDMSRKHIPVLPNFQIREPRESAFAMRKKIVLTTSQCISLSPKQASNARKIMEKLAHCREMPTFAK